MEVFGTVAGVIGLVTAIQEIYTTLEKVRGLPKAFDAAGTQLALVSRVFENAKTKAERAELNQDERKSLEAIAARSRDSLETLLDIFKSLQRKCGSDTDWPRIRGWYIELLKGKKAHRVEALMSEVLKDLELLRVSNDSVLATEEDIADIKRAIEGLSNVEPSVEDSELETVRSMTQNVSDHSTGNQFYQPDMQNSGPVFFGAISGGQHFGQRTNYYGPTTIQTGASNDPQPGAQFIVPFDRDPTFIHRADIIGWMERQHGSPHNRMALTGWGGYGKSQLAIYFAHWYHDKFPEASVFWIDATTKTSFAESYKSLASSLQLLGKEQSSFNTSALQVVKDRLQSELSGPWLMILDNADDLNVFFSGRNSVYESFLPKRNKGNILITSRSREVALRLTNNNDHCVKAISTMDETQSVALFRKRTSRPFPEADIEELVKVLGHIPLAITQAAAFLNHDYSETPATYLESFRRSDQSKESLLSQDFGDLRRDHSVSNSVVVTWQLTFEQIRQQTRSAANLLMYMSFFKPQRIPGFVLKEIWRQLQGESIEGPDAHMNTRFKNDMRVLVNHSLVSVAPDQSTYDMHPLVSFCTSVWLSHFIDEDIPPDGAPSTEKPIQWRDLVTAIFTGAMQEWFPDVWNEQNPQSIAMCEQLAPHLESLVDYKPPEEQKSDWLLLVYRYAAYLCTIWRLEEAEVYGRKAYELMSDFLGGERPSTRKARLLLVHVLVYRGGDHLKEASNLLHQAFDIEFKLLQSHWDKVQDYEAGELLDVVKGQCSPMLDIAHQRAEIYFMQKRWQEGQETLEVLLKCERPSLERLLGPGHDGIIGCKASLSYGYHKQGLLDNAAAIALEVSEGTRQRYEESPENARQAIKTLARMYQRQQRWHEAEVLLSQVLEKDKAESSEINSARLVVMYDLASIKVEQRSIQGLDLFRECHQVAVEKYGPNHGVTVRIETAKKEWEEVYAREGEEQWK